MHSGYINVSREKHPNIRDKSLIPLKTLIPSLISLDGLLLA